MNHDKKFLHSPPAIRSALLAQQQAQRAASFEKAHGTEEGQILANAALARAQAQTASVVMLVCKSGLPIRWARRDKRDDIKHGFIIAPTNEAHVRCKEHNVQGIAVVRADEIHHVG